MRFVFTGLLAVSFAGAAGAQQILSQTGGDAAINTDCEIAEVQEDGALIASMPGQRGVPLGDELVTGAGDEGLNPQPVPPRDLSNMRRMARTGGLRGRNAGEAGLNPQPSPPQAMNAGDVGLSPQPTPPQARGIGAAGLNPQPSPPEALDAGSAGLNPQPTPPQARGIATAGLNPQPSPPQALSGCPTSPTH
tara:strand:+ start:913 stop:1488 length:576 start_codon:yes stop_codon:yes gene_type:complete